jgi:DNA processing protein
VPRREPAPDDTPAPLLTAGLDEPERIACLRLIRSDNVGPVTFRELIGHFGTAAAALEALPDLARRGGRMRAARVYSKSAAEAELDAARRLGAEPLFTIEPGYPRALAATDAPPPMIYVKGSPLLLARPAVAIVGSRQASAAGTKLARLFASDIGRAGHAVVSGLARGIDAAAHEASLETGTIAVLAGGIDNVYPPENAALHRAIAEQGVLLTEQPPGFEPRAKDFPRRNRLISGLSLAVLVIEAARRSGTLITARFAAEQGREVFAVPGHPLDPRAEGTNQLLKNGATIATEPSDILGALEPLTQKRPHGLTEVSTGSTPRPLTATPPPPVTGKARDLVLAALGPQPIDVDEVVRSTGLGAREVRIVLMELDLAGRVERHGAQLVSRLEAREVDG